MFRNQASKEALSTANGHSHRSTGIASGLEYRDGYAVGGRVGYKNGKLVGGGNSFTDAINKANLELIQSLQAREIPTSDPIQLKDDPLFYPTPLVGSDVNFPMGDPFRRLQEPGPENRPRGMFGPMEETRELGQDLEPFAAERLRETVKGMGKAGITAAAGAPNFMSPTDPGPEGRPSDFYGSTKKVNTAKEAKNLYDDFFKTDKQINANRAKLDAELQKLRNEQDSKTKELSEKFNKATRTEAILQGLAAANDPTLPAGQSRVATGVGAFADRAATGRRERLERAERDQATKFLREESDLATKFSRAEDDIRREKDVRDYGLKLELNKKYDPEQTAALQEITYLLDQFGIEEGSAQHETIAVNRIIGKPVKEEDYSELRRKIADKMEEVNRTGDPADFRALIGLQPRFDKNQEPALLDAQDRILVEQMMISGATLENRELDANGGRVGYAVGGQVTKETLAPEEVAAVSSELNNNEVPILMNYSQLRSRLPEFVEDEIVSLIAHSPNAFKDFAIINNQADVEDFNNRYDVRLQLPDANSMDFSEAENKTSAMPAITVPSATSAQPTVAPQRSTGGNNLSPTEVAFLSPTEQAIKMRS